MATPTNDEGREYLNRVVWRDLENAAAIRRMYVESDSIMKLMPFIPCAPTKCENDQ